LASYPVDQAEGLRRLLDKPKSRVLTVISVLPEQDKNAMLVNLGASLAAGGSKVLVVDANASSGVLSRFVGSGDMPSLCDVLTQERNMYEAVRIVPQGFAFANIAKGTIPSAKTYPHASRLESIFNMMTEQADVTVVSGGLSVDDTFPVPAMDSGEIWVHVSPEPVAIKDAYLLLKRLNDTLGCRKFGLLVTGGTEQDAHTVFENMGKTASRYLAAQIDLVGFVPKDDHIKRASGLGKTVLDAFPRAISSQAFKQLAIRFLAPDQNKRYQVAAIDGASLGV
jgi:flagellar biosynthesis protein FlhG